MSGHGSRPWSLMMVGLVAAGLMLADRAVARDFKGVRFPDEMAINGQTCYLNGIGVRKKFFFSIYYGGLYLPTPSHDPAQVMAMDSPKGILLHVVYKEVGSEKWVDGWKEGFAVTAPQPSPELAKRIDAFLKCFDEPIRSGERILLTYDPATGTEVKIKGKMKATIPGRDFMTALWGIWLGKKPASESLMDGMLGR
jgi:hypothetical protein